MSDHAQNPPDQPAVASQSDQTTIPTPGAVEGDRVTKFTVGLINGSGGKAYGRRWANQRALLISRITHGRTWSIWDLTYSEARELGWAVSIDLEDVQCQ